MTQNIHEIKTLVAGLNKALRSFEESGHMSNMMADYVEDSIPKVIDYVNRAHSCSQKADDAIRKIETDKVVSLTDVMYIEQAYPGFHDRTDKVFTMSDSSQGLAGAIEAINWAKVGKVGIIGAILAAIASIIALIIKRRRDPDGVLQDMWVKARSREKDMELKIGQLDEDKYGKDPSKISDDFNNKVSKAISEKYNCDVSVAQVNRTYMVLKDDNITNSFRAKAFNEAVVDNILMQIIATSRDDEIRKNLSQAADMVTMFRSNSVRFKIYKTYLDSLKLDPLIKILNSVKKSICEKGVSLKERQSYLHRLEEAMDSVESVVNKYKKDTVNNEELPAGVRNVVREMVIDYGANLKNIVDTELLNTQNSLINSWHNSLGTLTSRSSETDLKIEEVLNDDSTTSEERHVIYTTKTAFSKGTKMISSLLSQTRQYYTTFNVGVESVSYFVKISSEVLDFGDEVIRE